MTQARPAWKAPAEQPEISVVVFEQAARWPTKLAPRLSGREGVCVLVQQPGEAFEMLFERLLRRIRRLDQPIAELVWVARSEGGALDVFWAVRALEHISQLGISGRCRLTLVQDQLPSDHGFEVASAAERAMPLAAS